MDADTREELRDLLKIETISSLMQEGLENCSDNLHGTVRMDRCTGFVSLGEFRRLQKLMAHYDNLLADSERAERLEMELINMRDCPSGCVECRTRADIALKNAQEPPHAER